MAYTGLTPDLVTFTRLPPNVVSLATLVDDPFFTVLHRAPDYAIICLPSGRIASCLLSDLDDVRSEYLAPLGREVLEFAPSPALAHPMRLATAPSPAIAHPMSPATVPSPATAHYMSPTTAPETRFHRPPTPHYLPGSPPSPRDYDDLPAPQPDVTYNHAATVFVHPIRTRVETRVSRTSRNMPSGYT